MSTARILPPSRSTKAGGDRADDGKPNFRYYNDDDENNNTNALLSPSLSLSTPVSRREEKSPFPFTPIVSRFDDAAVMRYASLFSFVFPKATTMTLTDDDDGLFQRHVYFSVERGKRPSCTTIGTFSALRRGIREVEIDASVVKNTLGEAAKTVDACEIHSISHTENTLADVLVSENGVSL